MNEGGQNFRLGYDFGGGDRQNWGGQFDLFHCNGARRGFRLFSYAPPPQLDSQSQSERKKCTPAKEAHKLL